MKHLLFCISLAAALAPAASLAAAPAGAIVVAPGQSIGAALQQAQWQSHLAALVAARGPIAQDDAQAAVSQPPAIFSGSVVSGRLVVGDPTTFPVMNFRFKSDHSGLLGATFTFTSPSAGGSIGLAYFPAGYTTKGNITFSNSFTLPSFLEPGAWTLTEADIYTYGGARRTYTGSQLAKLIFPASLDVVDNGPVDTKPPVPTSGKVLTPTVSLANPLPQLRVAIGATDDVSGYDQAYVLITPPDSPYAYATQVTQSFPVKSGRLVTVANLPSGFGRGKYAISGYAVCDLAGNCLTDQSSYDVKALFGTTTFIVTK